MKVDKNSPLKNAKSFDFYMSHIVGLICKIGCSLYTKLRAEFCYSWYSQMITTITQLNLQLELLDIFQIWYAPVSFTEYAWAEFKIMHCGLLPITYIYYIYALLCNFIIVFIAALFFFRLPMVMSLIGLSVLLCVVPTVFLMLDKLTRQLQDFRTLTSPLHASRWEQKLNIYHIIIIP